MKGSHASAEQRREKRDALLAGQLLVVDLISDSPAFRTHGIVLNLSKGGMAVQTFRPLPQGRVAEIQLSLPKFSSSAGCGVVEWQKQGGVAGIRFLPPLKTLADLRQWVQRYPSTGDPESAVPLVACRSRSSTSEFETTLHLFAWSAMALTGATGAAIALGSRSAMACRASVGSAPDLGAPLRPDSGISGHSLRTGAVILCHDLWSDSRADAAAARQMDVRSIVIVPITMAEEVVGLLEVFSQAPNHFEERHVQQLQPLMNVLADAIGQETGNNPTEDPGQSPSATAIEAVEPEEPAAANFAAYPQSTRHFRTIVIALVVMAALLILIFALAHVSSRLRSRSPANRSSPISAQHGANPGVSGTLPAARAVIAFSPAAVSRKVGATFDVDVVLKGARDLSSVPVQILYNPQKLQLVTVTSGGLLDRDGQAAALVRRVDASAGRLYVSVSRPPSAPGISGDGVVFTLGFLSKASGRSKLRVDQASLRDISARAVPVDSSEAMITVSASTTPAASAAQHAPAQTHPPPAALSRNTEPDRSVLRNLPPPTQ